MKHHLSLREYLKEKLTIRNLYKCSIYGSFLCLIASYFIFRNKPDIFRNIIFRRQYPAYRPVIDNSSSYINLLRETATTIFKNYKNTCINSDAYRPISGSCINLYGFHDTLIESLETLYLLGLNNLYSEARNYLVKNFKCSKLGWVNRRELYSRLIGSFIGTYLLTSDEYFLREAMDCASISVEIDSQFKYPKPFHNMANHSYKKKMWLNGTALQDVSPGMPELVSLYYLTGNPIYIQYYKKVVKALPKKKGVFYYSILTIPRGLNGTVMRRMDGFTVGFYHNLAIAHGMHPTPAGSHALNKTQEITYVSGSENRPLIPLLHAAASVAGTDSKFLYNGIDGHMSSIKSLYEDVEQVINSDSGFRYDGIFLNVLLGLGDRGRKIIKNATRTVFEMTATGNGFSGRRPKKNAPNVPDDIQHPDAIGHWLKVAALAEQPKLAASVVLNERGHILMSPLLYKSDESTAPSRCADTRSRSFSLFC